MANLTKIKKDCRAARDALARARKGHYALGAFNLDNQETLVAVVKAALAKKASVLVEVSQGEVEAIGLNNVRDLVDNYKADYDIEMYINLDETGKTFELLEKYGIKVDTGNLVERRDSLQLTINEINKVIKKFGLHRSEA